MLFYKELELLENSITIGIKKPFLSEFTKTNKKRPKKGANPTLTDENGQFHGELRADISIGTQLKLFRLDSDIDEFDVLAFDQLCSPRFDLSYCFCGINLFTEAIFAESRWSRGMISA